MTRTSVKKERAAARAVARMILCKAIKLALPGLGGRPEDGGELDDDEDIFREMALVVDNVLVPVQGTLQMLSILIPFLWWQCSHGLPQSSPPTPM